MIYINLLKLAALSGSIQTINGVLPRTNYRIEICYQCECEIRVGLITANGCHRELLNRLLSRVRVIGQVAVRKDRIGVGGAGSSRQHVHTLRHYAPKQRLH